MGMCACTHMHVSLCAYLCVCESFAFTFGADSCKPHGLVSSRHRTAVGTAWSNLWLPLLACLATGCGGNVNEGRVSGPTASCRGCDICLLTPTAEARGKSRTTGAGEGRAAAGNVGASWGLFLGVTGAQLVREKDSFGIHPQHIQLYGPGSLFPLL